MKILTYNGNVEHIVGEVFECPRFMRNGGIRTARWVATRATYVPDWDKTFVEMDPAYEGPVT